MSGEDEDTLRAKANVGRVLGKKWTLEKVIGVGGMAAVYAAAHRTGSRAAVKILHPDLAHHEEVRARFLREAYIANTVEHEGVVTVIDDDMDENGCPYLVMELLVGQSLAQLAKKAGGRLAIPDVLKIADQSLAVLEAAHAKGIVHRDLKPDNLFMTDKGVLKVLDFGIARLRDGKTNRTKTGLLMGTPSFMAPEQALGRTADIDSSTDQWAIGATLFTLLSGKDVHEANSDNELIIYAATRPARSLASVMDDAPAALVEIIDRSLAYDRVKRFPDAAAMRAALQPLLEELGTSRHNVVDVRGVGAGGGAGAGAGTGIGKAATGAEAPRKRTSMQRGQKTDVSEEEADLDADEEDALGGNLSGAKELFQRFEKSLTTKHQYGQAHPETARRFEALFQKATEELAKNAAGLAVNVNPYSFYVGTETLWEPKPPLDEIPYRLFADGVRLIGFLPGLTEKELSGFLQILVSDPVKDIPPGDNLLTLLWDAAFEHIVCEEVDSFSEGDQAARQKFEMDRKKIMVLARFDTTDLLHEAWQGRAGERQKAGVKKHQTTISRITSKITSVASDASRVATLRTFVGDRKDAPPATAGELLKLDEITRAQLAAQLQADMSAVGERFVIAAAHAYQFAARQGKPQAVTGPLRIAIDGLTKEAAGDAVEFVAALCRAVETPKAEETEALRAQFAGQLISAEGMKRLLDAASAPGTGVQTDFAKSFTVILSYLDGTHLPAVLEALLAVPNTPLLETFMKYVARVATGREAEIGALLAVAETDLALALLRLLASMGTQEAKQCAAIASKNPNAVVRVEAIGQLEGVSSERLRVELRRLLEDGEPAVRIAALVSMATYKIKIAGPFLVLRVRSPAFATLPLEERKQALATLVELAPARAEAVAIELLKDKGGMARLMNKDATTQTRLLAIEVLDKVGVSGEAVDALSPLTRGGWLTDDRVRDRSMLAMNAVLKRSAQAAGQRR